ncbi:lipopolysaccharide heptosyltransferase II [Leptospira sp. 85282-16]|uniref:lipopolysaccharide heptosyltransferase II n=1 Tax=Leptospira montravelensis TaxID=2484961 RepID=A0ABY2LXC8_9LEPT|nr:MULTISPECIES: lipopolysaccharide heptosyltransferase II [Leptospira]MCT8332452.1 lipopolysaccharide heptosyltransferase II [Leptospira sp. 85282-16]TGK83676.1 lipopolysaccharide heptosyltransferase II [Leptospira montravelensis]TGL05679.1 lipopolysaccharide heptosyltransferase II [Leptospira montravelensis]
MPEKILIIQTAFLGDLILSTSFFHAVKTEHPGAEIHVLVNAGTESVLDNNPDITKVWSLDKKRIKKNPFAFLHFAGLLKKESFNKVYSAHFSFRSSLLSYLTRAPIRIGYKESGFSFLHTKTVQRPKQGPHEVEKLFSLLFEEYDFPKGRERRPYLFPGQLEEESFSKTKKDILNNEEGYILVAPSSLWETKRMPEEKFVSVITQILRKRKETVILIGSKADLEIENTIFRLMKTEPLQLRERSRLLSLVGKTNLKELMVWIQNAKAIISNDSSPIHFASAFNTPTVMLYGATIPAFGYGSLSDQHKIMEVQGLNCRPCGIHGGRICPEGHFRCMMDQNPVRIFEALEEIIKV